MIVPKASPAPDANVNVSTDPSTLTCDSLTGRTSGAAAAVGLHMEATTRAIRLIENRLHKPLTGHGEPGMLQGTMVRPGVHHLNSLVHPLVFASLCVMREGPAPGSSVWP